MSTQYAVDLVFGTAKADSQLARMEAKLKRLDQAGGRDPFASVSRGASAAEGKVGSLIGVVGKLGGALALAGTAMAIFKETANLETQVKSIEVLTGSLSKTKDIVAQIKAYGAVTPFTSAELIDVTKRLAAFGVETDKLVGTTKRLGDLAGASGANINELALAYGQVMSKGRVQTEELLQFQERGIGIQGELQKMYGLSGEAMQEAISKGQVPAEALEVAIIRLTSAGGKYANGAIAQSDTLNGKLSTLQDSFQTLAQKIGAVVTPALKGMFDVAIDALDAINRVFERVTDAKILQEQTRRDMGDRRLTALGNEWKHGSKGKVDIPLTYMDAQGNVYSTSTGTMIKAGSSRGSTSGSSAGSASKIPALTGGTGSGSKSGGQSGGRSNMPNQGDINARALLDTIRYAEGTYHPRGYGTHFGGSYTPPGGLHPDRVIRAGGYASAAYGAYQFMPDTWRGIGGGAMTPSRQDAGALRLIRQRGVDPTQSLTRGMIDKLAPEWASFPTLRTGTSYYGQGGKSFAELERFYRARVAKGGGDVGDVDLALGRENISMEEDRIRAAEREAKEAARLAQEAAKDLAMRKDRLAISETELKILKASTPELKIEAEFQQDILRIKQEMAGLTQDDTTKQLEKNLLLGAEEIKRGKINELLKQQAQQQAQLVVQQAQQQEAAMRPLLDDIERLEAIFKGPAAVKALDRRNAIGALMGAGVDPSKAGGLVDQKTQLQDIYAEQQRIEAAYRSIGDTIRQSVGSSINELIRGTITWQEALVGVLDNLASALLQMGLSGIFDGLGGGGGFLGKLFSPQASFAGGGYTGSGSRSGGVDGMGGFPAILHPNETVIDHSRGGITQSMGNVNVTVHNNGSSTVTGDDASRLGNMVQAAVAATIQREQRPGGTLNRRR